MTRSRPARRSVVVLSGSARTGDRVARALATSLDGMGVEATYIGREQSPERIADEALERRADSIELCLAGTGIALVRELLRELRKIGRSNVSIVVHRVE